MRICDKCRRRHADYTVKHWDICGPCLSLLTRWIKDPDMSPCGNDPANPT